MAKTSAALKRIADAGIPLFQSLNDAQRGRYEILARMLRPHHHHMHSWNDGDGAITAAGARVMVTDVQ
jgi:hypothetical protein